VTLTFDLNMYRGHLLSMTNLPTKYHNCQSETFQDIGRTWFCIKCYCDLDIWPTDLKIYSGHLLTMTNLPTKNDCQSWTLKILSGHGFCIKCYMYCDLDTWPSNLKLLRVIYWKWPIFLPSTMTVTHNFSRYWAEMVFASNATVT